MLTRLWLIFALRLLAAPMALDAQAPAGVARGSPSFAPDGSLIAYVTSQNGSDEIFVIAPDGSRESQVTRSGGQKGAPRWMRDGRHLTYTVVTGEETRVFEIDLDGASVRQIADVPGRGVELSPDGTRLVYWVGTWTSATPMVARLDGSARHAISGQPSIFWNMKWAPDGRQVAYTGQDANKSLNIFLMNDDGSAPRQVTHLAPAEGRAQVPSWSPDGRSMAFQVNNLETHTAHIWIADVATGASRKLTSHGLPYLDETPSWFPDGRRLAFQSNRTGQMEIWTIAIDGSDARQITGR